MLLRVERVIYLFIYLLGTVPLHEYNILFFLSPIDGHLGYFQFEVLKNKLLGTFLCMSSVGHKTLIFLEFIPRN